MKILVSGSTGGIGYAIAAAMAEQGHEVAIHSRNPTKSQIVADELSQKFHVRTIGLGADLAKVSDVDELIAMLNEHDFLPDVLVNNSGKYYADRVGDSNFRIQEALNDNLLTAIHLTSALLPMMKAANKGHIINICSIVSNQIRPEAASYTIAKSALLTYAKLLKLSVKEYNIKVSNVFPGSVFTPSWEGTGVSPEQIIPAGTIGELVKMILNQPDSVEIDEIHLRAFKFD
jgi:short-subunit dehydrogenase